MNYRSFLSEIDGIIFEQDRDLSKKSTFNLKAKGDLIMAKTIDGLKQALIFLSRHNINFRLLGLGANQLLPKESNDPYIKLDFDFDSEYLKNCRDFYDLPASLNLNTLTAHALKFGLKGWEVFTGIPATLGGAVFMNAGTNLGEIGSLVSQVKCLTRQGKEKIYEITESSFSYRKNNFLKEDEIIVEVRITHHGIDRSISAKIKDYLAKRREEQPLEKKTCGCVFKNYQLDGETCLAGKFIDIMGLKGFTLGELKISPVHANFIENTGEADRSDVIHMIECIKYELELQYGIKFETEIKI